ncbi:C2 calcium-dependent membrane targeting [Macleaya cordata]|uniref:C2 calcium-dependent membrane targeting n=1 Tax=Macleaya cordata TaxID=56857 RepID=A0A200QGZ0_MACCD|nr:C2 calcium-dependent membrane targeting [Macleaya cordata]
MEQMSSMELKVMSCKGLRAFNFFQKLCVYVMVSIVCEDPSGKQKKRRHQQQKTPIDKEGDGDPEWKHEMRFDLKEIVSSSSSSSSDHLFLEFDLLCEGMILGDKSIGKVRVPFEDLMEEFNGAVRFVSYQVQTPDGKPNGVLNFSYKVIGKENKIGTGFPFIDNSNLSPIVHPSSSVCYPTVDVHNPSPTFYYPSPAEVHHPSSEVFYLAPPPPPPPHPQAGMVYYPPPPQPVFYPPPPVPYGYGIGGYGHPQFGYPTIGQPHQPHGDAWHKGWEQREGTAGSWSFR